VLLPAGLAGSGTAAPVCVHTLHDSTGCPRKRPMHRGNASWIRSRTCSPRTTHFILRQPGAIRQVSWHQDSSLLAAVAQQDRHRVAGDRGRRAPALGASAGALRAGRMPPAAWRGPAASQRASARPGTPLTLRRGALVGAAVTAVANTGLARAWLAWCFLEQNPSTVPPRRSGPTGRCSMPRLRRPGRRSWRHWS